MERNKEETKKTYTRQYIISYYSFHQKEKSITKEPQSANSYTPKIVYIENNQQQDAAFSKRTYHEHIRERNKNH